MRLVESVVQRLASPENRDVFIGERTLAPLRGLRPRRGPRCLTENDPKPRSSNSRLRRHASGGYRREAVTRRGYRLAVPSPRSSARQSATFGHPDAALMQSYGRLRFFCGVEVNG